MEPVTIEVKVRRGNDTILQFYLDPRSSYTWSSFSFDHDIQTPNGGLCELIVMPTIRRDHNLWRNGVPAFVEEPALATKPLDLDAAEDSEDWMPF